MTEKMKCVRVGFGTVFKLHEDKLSKCGVETAGVVEIAPEKIEKARSSYAVYKTISEAAVQRPDFWDICTPSDHHFTALEEILSIDPKAKVIVEKPICTHEQIREAERLLKAHPEAKITVNENYLSSTISERMKTILNTLKLKPRRIIAESTKHRGEDFANGRYCDRSLFAFGYEGPHMLTLISGLDEGYMPGEIKQASLSDALIKMKDGSTKNFEKQGTAHAEYKSKSGIDVILHTSMIGEVKYPYDPHSEKPVPQEDPKTRYRILAAECDGVTVVGFLDPIRGFERTQGSVSIIIDGKVYRDEPILDDTMGNQLRSAVEYFQGKRDTPCKPEIAIDIVSTLHELVSRAR